MCAISSFTISNVLVFSFASVSTIFWVFGRSGDSYPHLTTSDAVSTNNLRTENVLVTCMSSVATKIARPEIGNYSLVQLCS